MKPGLTRLALSSFLLFLVVLVPVLTLPSASSKGAAEQTVAFVLGRSDDGTTRAAITPVASSNLRIEVRDGAARLWSRDGELVARVRDVG